MLGSNPKIGTEQSKVMIFSIALRTKETLFRLRTNVYRTAMIFCVSTLDLESEISRRQEILAVALRNFGGGVSNFWGFGRQQNFFQGASKFLPVRKFISSCEKIYFFQGENLFLPVKKFTGNREKIYGFTNSYLSTTYKDIFFGHYYFLK